MFNRKGKTVNRKIKIRLSEFFHHHSNVHGIGKAQLSGITLRGFSLFKQERENPRPTRLQIKYRLDGDEKNNANMVNNPKKY